MASNVTLLLLRRRVLICITVVCPCKFVLLAARLFSSSSFFVQPCCPICGRHYGAPSPPSKKHAKPLKGMLNDSRNSPGNLRIMRRYDRPLKNKENAMSRLCMDQDTLFQWCNLARFQQFTKKIHWTNDIANQLPDRYQEYVHAETKKKTMNPNDEKDAEAQRSSVNSTTMISSPYHHHLLLLQYPYQQHLKHNSNKVKRLIWLMILFQLMITRLRSLHPLIRNNNNNPLLQHYLVNLSFTHNVTFIPYVRFLPMKPSWNILFGTCLGLACGILWVEISYNNGLKCPMYSLVPRISLVCSKWVMYYWRGTSF